MNFTPFGTHFSTAIPTIHQFAAKFSNDNGANGLCPPQENNSSRYTANGVPSFTQHHPPQQQMVTSSKFHGNYVVNQNGYAQQRQDKRYEHEMPQERCGVVLQHGQGQQQEKVKQDNSRNQQQQQQQNVQNQHQQTQVQHVNQQNNNQNQQTMTTTASLPASWQSLAATGSAVADYLSHLPVTTLTLSLHQYLEYKAENMKKESTQHVDAQNGEQNLNLLHSNLNTNVSLNGLSTINTAQIQGVTSTKKKKKKKVEKEKKPRPKPGEIRLTTALDGSTLYCCPECHMAYPEKELLEQHLVGHTLERRFVCDICGAGLKRKDHLTRHKQSHNPERPYVCTVCLKAFKRKEQLTLHFVIHSGEKRHVCTECGKGFYRKDHLRKHTRSHIARRVKAELSQQGGGSQGMHLQVAAPSASTVALQGILS